MPFSTAAFAAVLIALLVSLGAGEARADIGAACGATITSETTLDTDLSCAGGGLVVVSATLDLNGHHIVGAGTGTGVTLQGTGAAVVNGSVGGFADGVRMSGQNPSVQGVTVSYNSGRGVVVFVGGGGVSGAEIEFSTITGNASDGVLLGGVPNTTVDQNTITYNGGSGIAAVGNADSSRFTDNQVTDNIGYGIFASDSTSKARGNTVLRNALGGILFSEDVASSFARGYVITANKAISNSGVGISACLNVSGTPCAPGMIDGGGNIARTTYGGPDCVNIVCARRAPTDPGVTCGSTITTDTTLAADLSCAGPGVVVDSATLDLNGHTLTGAGTDTGVALQGTSPAVVNGTVTGFFDGIRMGGLQPSVQGVTASANAEYGVRVFSFRPGGPFQSEIEFSTVTANGSDGVALGDVPETVVEGSTITHNGGSGIEAGLNVDASRYNDNLVTDNAGYGIYAFTSTSKARANTVLRNGLAGIYFYEDAAPSFALGYVLTANKAVSNGGVGISACLNDQLRSGDRCAPGMIDGGGNIARNNDTGVDCINIACARR